ncbi:hypothetical protein NQ317_006940 [Molorchus minor]|uniref:SEC7 domain-containing protein n=1 Tax=Molorchus minor TaxID=1323400 RepID=A0ABQ9JM68_9CUCU|nr:hypothetical protein NQ317_006940 [Molorchus minor]
MSLPGNGIFVVKGEMSILMTAMRRNVRWSSHSYQEDDIDALMKSFQELKEILNKIDDLRLVEPNAFLSPFLDVIRSEETTGPVTSLALSAINKFLCYGIIDPTHSSIPHTVHNIADAVTHARFVGTDQSSDGVVLMRILQVLRTLTLAPEGATLTNESLCEIMLSCFRICFETRLNELLRRTAEHYLKDMVQLVFMRLPQFSDDLRAIALKQLKMRPGAMDQTRTKRKHRQSFRQKDKTDSEDVQSPVFSKPQITSRTNHISTTPMTPGSNIVDMQGSISQNTPQNVESGDTTAPSSFPATSPNENESETNIEINVQCPSPNKEDQEEDKDKSEDSEKKKEDPNHLTTTLEEVPNDNQQPASNDSNLDYVNQRGIRFTPQLQEEAKTLVPYGLACVRELFRFLINLCNPLDKQNTDVNIHLGLTLLTVAFEVGADSIGKLLNTERLSVFAANLQVSFLMFESLRSHLKYQLENYLNKLMEIIISDSVKTAFYNCGGYQVSLANYISTTTAIYTVLTFTEELTKLLAKNAFSATSGVYHTHLLSLDALLTVIEGIEMHCCNCKNENRLHDANDPISNGNDRAIENINSFIGKSSRVKTSEDIPNKEELTIRKIKKKWLPQGTEHFNLKPKKGIQFLQEHGVLKQELDYQEIALFLRENPGLDKKMIGEYISNRSNLNILEAFVKTFDFTDVRIDEALRMFLETFRLPGESPTISLILEHFAESWHKSNGEPFADVDSAFTLAYAVIMLNVDQHNRNAKKAEASNERLRF